MSCFKLMFYKVLGASGLLKCLEIQPGVLGLLGWFCAPVLGFNPARLSCWKIICQAPKIALNIMTTVIFNHPLQCASGCWMITSQIPKSFLGRKSTSRSFTSCVPGSCWGCQLPWLWEEEEDGDKRGANYPWYPKFPGQAESYCWELPCCQTAILPTASMK